MPAHERVSIPQIVEALVRWHGNLRAAAEELGIRRKNLKERIDAARLDVNVFRKRGTRLTRTGGMARMRGQAGIESLGSKTSVVPFTSGREEPTVRSMNAGSLAVEEPIKRRVLPRIRPEHLDRLTEAKYDLQAIFRRDVTETEILGEFLDACLETWLREKLGSAKPKRGRKGENGGEPR